MVSRGRLQMAIFVLLAVSTYLRPGQLFLARRRSLIPPAPGVTSSWALLLHPQEVPGDVSKTNESDVSILLDSRWLRWMDPMLAELAKGLPDARMWDFDWATFLQEFKDGVRALGWPTA
eukprot:8453320-Lingulodinium_polyedra.AAC.1